MRRSCDTTPCCDHGNPPVRARVTPRPGAEYAKACPGPRAGGGALGLISGCARLAGAHAHPPRRSRHLAVSTLHGCTLRLTPTATCAVNFWSVGGGAAPHRAPAWGGGARGPVGTLVASSQAPNWGSNWPAEPVLPRRACPPPGHHTNVRPVNIVVDEHKHAPLRVKWGGAAHTPRRGRGGGATLQAFEAGNELCAPAAPPPQAPGAAPHRPPRSRNSQHR